MPDIEEINPKFGDVLHRPMNGEFRVMFVEHNPRRPGCFIGAVVTDSGPEWGLRVGEIGDGWVGDGWVLEDEDR